MRQFEVQRLYFLDFFKLITMIIKMVILGGLSDRLVDSEMRAGGSRTSLASGKFASNESLHLGGGAPQEQPEVSKRITCPLAFLMTSHLE